MVTANEQALPSVDDLDLPFFDYNEPGLVGEVYHQRLAEVRRQGWLARSPLSLVVLDQESGEFFLRAKQTAFPGREIADLFGVTGGRLREQIDANILNQTGERHRRLRALVGPAFTPRAAARWRPVMRDFAQRLWASMGTGECEFVASFAKPYPSLTIAAVLGAPLQDAPRLHEWSTWVQRQFDIRALGTEPERIERATEELYDYVEGLLELRRREPSDDLISALLAAEEEGEQAFPRRVHQPGAQRHRRGRGHHPGPALPRAAAVRRAPGAVGPARPRAGPDTRRGRRGAAGSSRSRRSPRGSAPAEIEYRGVVFPAGSIVAICVGAGQPRTTTPVRSSTSPPSRRPGADVRRRTAFLPRSEPGPGGTGRGLGFLAPRMRDLHPAAPAELGGVEGIYGIESLPLAWSQV